MRRHQAPGWYEHPEMVNTMGYWDGTKWTDQHMPAPAEGKRSGKVSIGRVLAAVLVVVLVAGAVATCERQRDEERENCRLDREYGSGDRAGCPDF